MSSLPSPLSRVARCWMAKARTRVVSSAMVRVSMSPAWKAAMSGAYAWGQLRGGETGEQLLARAVLLRHRRDPRGGAMEAGEVHLGGLPRSLAVVDEPYPELGEPAVAGGAAVRAQGCHRAGGAEPRLIVVVERGDEVERHGGRRVGVVDGLAEVGEGLEAVSIGDVVLPRRGGPGPPGRARGPWARRHHRDVEVEGALESGDGEPRHEANVLVVEALRGT
mmetsp:Transcript_37575/g.118476  ORF Transcript_37575/g.118476 Transcript_37575/m.118476 type:complete len:221 (-) Transcript_37575:195-857(-)